MSFKKNFLWGAATSSYQIEGAAFEDGKGLSIWDVFTHEPGRIFGGHNGDVACDSYHRYKDDVRLMKEIGIKAYRFSISWPRIFPSGTGSASESGVEFYSRLIDELLENGIVPYITLFHWDYPYELYKRGGWLNSDSVKWFADYAAYVVSRFSDRVENFITFNEPQCFIGSGFFKGDHAPGLKCPNRDVFLMCHNVLKAHGAAVSAMRAAAKRKIRIGYAPTATMAYPASETAADIEAARKKLFSCPELSNWTWNLSWWSDPIILGKYPEDGLKKYADYLPEITDDDMRLISAPIDFYCQNIYRGVEVAANDNGEPVVIPGGRDERKSSMGWPITPKCLRWGPRFLYERYGLPICITENGTALHDSVTDGAVHDEARIRFIEDYVSELSAAADDGVDIEGYFYWSLMDNFEWAYGYSERFGLVYVDYETQDRIIKDSGLNYSDIMRRHMQIQE